MKTIQERIDEILKEFNFFDKSDNDCKIIRLMLEALVIQAQLEQLQKEK